jgi:hypothetical protein
MIKIIKKGVHYILGNMTDDNGQEVVFTHRDKDRTPVAGTTREAVYQMLIDKIEHDDSKNPKHENKIQLRHIRAAYESQRVVVKTKIESDYGRVH